MVDQAFILRIRPADIDRMPEALRDNQLIVGWSEARGLLEENLKWEEFRRIVSEGYYADEPNLRRAGAAAGHLWRFIREMHEGDLVVVPYGTVFYVAKVTGCATHTEELVADDTAYRRLVEWLNCRNGIPRSMARSALISRMKTYGTCAHANDLRGEIEECLKLASNGEIPTFSNDLQARLIRETLVELRGGRIDPFGFENLIKSILEALGAVEARVIARNQDKGADVLATFRIAGAFQQIVAVQAKHWQPEPEVDGKVVEQLIRGIEAESANFGMVITTGSFNSDASKVASDYFEKEGIKIELVDGEQFAKLIVEHGIRGLGNK